MENSQGDEKGEADGRSSSSKIFEPATLETESFIAYPT
jgi:hypothetical protein